MDNTTPIYDQTMTDLGYGTAGENAVDGQDEVDDPGAGRHRGNRDDAAKNRSSRTTLDSSGKPGPSPVRDHR